MEIRACHLAVFPREVAQPQRQAVEQDALGAFGVFLHRTCKLKGRLDRYPMRGPLRPMTCNPFGHFGVVATGRCDVSDALRLGGQRLGEAALTATSAADDEREHR